MITLLSMYFVATYFPSEFGVVIWIMVILAWIQALIIDIGIVRKLWK